MMVGFSIFTYQREVQSLSEMPKHSDDVCLTQ
jgi:hypothetical protein